MSHTSPRHLHSLGRAIRVQRAHLDLSQEAAGLRGGIHRNYLGAIERGEINPTYSTLRRVAEALNIPLDRLIRDAERGADQADGEPGG